MSQECLCIDTTYNHEENLYKIGVERDSFEKLPSSISSVGTGFCPYVRTEKQNDTTDRLCNLGSDWRSFVRGSTSCTPLLNSEPLIAKNPKFDTLRSLVPFYVPTRT